MQATDLHTFHIPVMGLAFSIDSPLKVARYGISSVLSLNDDILMEQMREYYSRLNGEPFEPLDTNQDDHRAKRITAYLNLLDRLVNRQMAALRREPFDQESDITKYFSLLPDRSALKARYLQMLQLSDPEAKKQAQEALRAQVRPGAIVSIS